MSERNATTIGAMFTWAGMVMSKITISEVLNHLLVVVSILTGFITVYGWVQPRITKFRRARRIRKAHRARLNKNPGKKELQQ